MKIETLVFRWGSLYQTPITVPSYVNHKGEIIPNHHNTNSDTIKVTYDK